MSTLLVAELVLACVLLAILLLVVGMIWRRRAIASGYPMALAAVSRDGRRWRLGLLRLGPTTLGWYPVVATSTRPRLEWDRAHLELSTPTDETVSIPGLSDAVRVDVGDHATSASTPLAVERGNYMAMRSWLESSPPGQDVNVA